MYIYLSQFIHIWSNFLKIPFIISLYLIYFTICQPQLDSLKPMSVSHSAWPSFHPAGILLICFVHIYDLLID